MEKPEPIALSPFDFAALQTRSKQNNTVPVYYPLSFLLPFMGFYYFFHFKKENKKRAMICLGLSIAAIIIAIILLTAK